MHTEPTSTKDLIDSIFRQFVLDLATRVKALEEKEAAKVPEQKPKTPPTPIAQVGEVWVNRSTLSDYTIISVEVVEDLIIYTAEVNGVRMRLQEFPNNFVRRSAAPANKKELRDMATEITTNIIPHIQFIGVVDNE